VPTNKQRREAERRHLERQLRNRRVREARRRKTTLIVSVSMTIVLIAAIVVTVVLLSSGTDKKKSTASKTSHSSSTSASPSPTTSTSVAPLGTPAACAKPPKKIKNDTVSYKGVTVKNATNLKKAPVVTSKATKPLNALSCQDLVIGKGAKAKPTSTVSVQYLGALYDNGTKFDSSWDRGGKPISFPLQQVVPGFTQGIGGTGKVAPMRVGGRRIMILPSQLGYGSTAQQNIPANSTLVFVVDLTKVSAPAASSSPVASPSG
jgi:FKBP-type peptidyl-prolyl cis-trans isomerase